LRCVEPNGERSGTEDVREYLIAALGREVFFKRCM
jgi:hypothetical protein